MLASKSSGVWWRGIAGLVMVIALAFLRPSGEADQAVEPVSLVPAANASVSVAAPAPATAPAATPAVAAGSKSPFAVPLPGPLPPAIAVSRFKNLSSVKSLDWMEAAVAFTVGEKLAAHGGVRTELDPLVVPDRLPATTPADIAAIAAADGASLVIAGNFSRPDWKLQITFELWKVSGNRVTKIGTKTHRGEFEQVHQFVGSSLVELLAGAGLPVSRADLAEVTRAPSADFYAFTLFGRGLSALLEAGDLPGWKIARKNLERSVFIDPTLAEGQRVLGELYRRYGETRWAKRGKDAKTNFDGLAQIRFERALEQRPSYVGAQLALARSNADRMRLDNARDLLHDAVKRRPYDFEARYQLGRVLWENGQADDSYKVLSQLVKQRPDDVRIHRTLVLIHSSRSDGKALVSELEQVVRLDPDDQRTRMDLGAAYAAVGKSDRAIETYEGVVKRKPKNASALKFLGDLHRKQGRHRHAIKYYGLALRAAPNDPRSYFTLGAVYVEVGDDAKAKRVFQRAQRFRRYLPEVHTNLGAIAYREGDLAEAIAYQRKAIKAEPRKVRFRYNLALALSAAGEVDDALTEVEAALSLDPKHVELTYLKGVVLLRRGDVLGASVQFERTLQLSPSHGGARHNIEMIAEIQRKAEEGEVIRERPR
jgi:Flp pilus assembly protein TadD